MDQHRQPWPIFNACSWQGFHEMANQSGLTFIRFCTGHDISCLSSRCDNGPLLTLMLSSVFNNNLSMAAASSVALKHVNEKQEGCQRSGDDIGVPVWLVDVLPQEGIRCMLYLFLLLNCLCADQDLTCQPDFILDNVLCVLPICHISPPKLTQALTMCPQIC